METQTQKETFFQKPWVHSLGAVILIFGALGGFLFWQNTRGKVFIENAFLDAPIINLSATAPGTLNALYVKEGDVVEPNTQVALVGSQILTAKEAGVVTAAPNVIGNYFSPGQTVVSFVKTSGMKVVGTIEETKGLNKLAVNQPVTFTVDAFPGKKFTGVLETVSATSTETGVAFAISDKRPTKKFNVVVRFDAASYTELKNGMSAKITVDTRS
jgi:multidrug resistance efflux pump